MLNAQNNYGINQQNQSLKSYFSGNALDITEVPSWFPKANLSRTQTDLIATSPEGKELVFVDYFTNHELPSIQTENGLLFNGSLINTLAGPLAPGQYAQAAGEGALSIGEVSSVTGTARAIRLDGNEFSLSNGDPIFQGDTIEVSGSGAVGLVFLDKTTLSLSDGGKMVLDELVYDPETGTGSMAVDMVEGAFSFISGEIAKTGEDAMTIKTPVATIGIRGTTVAGKAAVEGNENSFTLLQDSDGGVGQISVSNAGGTQVLAQVGATTSIASFNAPPPPPVILSAAQIQANYGTALNVLPPTPAVAPQPQAAPPPQEEQQEQAQEEAQEEDEGTEEEAAEEAAPEEGEGEGEEGPGEGEEGPPVGPDGEPLEEGEEGPPVGPDGEPLAEGEGGPLEEASPSTSEEEPLPPGGEEGPSEEQVAAREAFDTAMAAGASPEQAMAEAAAAGGFDEPIGGPEDFGPGGGPLDGPVNNPLGNMGMPMPGGMDSFGGGPSLMGSPMPGMGPVNPMGGPISGSIMGPAFGPGPMDMMGGSIMGPAFGPGPMDMMSGSMMGSAFGPGGPMGMMGGPMMGPAFGPGPMGIVENYIEPPMQDYFFEDPSLYDDYREDPEPPEESSEGSGLLTITGTAASETIDKTGSNDGFILKGFAGDDVLKGGNQDDIIVGGSGGDQMTGGLGDDKFYYKSGNVDGIGKDLIWDFGTGADKIVSQVNLFATSAYTRSTIQTDAQQFGSTYNLSSNSNQLPLVFNFTYNTTAVIMDGESSLASHLSTFQIIPSTGSTGLGTAEKAYLAGGDGTFTNIWLWDDHNQTGTITADELYEVVKLVNFNNDTLTGSEFLSETITGV